MLDRKSSGRSTPHQWVTPSASQNTTVRACCLSCPDLVVIDNVNRATVTRDHRRDRQVGLRWRTLECNDHCKAQPRSLQSSTWLAHRGTRQAAKHQALFEQHPDFSSPHLEGESTSHLATYLRDVTTCLFVRVYVHGRLAQDD